MSTLIIPLGLAFLMVCVGLETRVADFRALAQGPRGVAAGVVFQIAGLPLLAAGIAHLAGLPVEHAIGLILVAAAPGGVTANFVTLMAAGDVALCVTVTVLGSLAAPFTVPVVVGLAFDRFAGGAVDLTLPVGPTIGAVFVTTVVPLVIGIGLAERRPDTVARLRRHLRRASFAVFLVIVVTAIASQWSALLTSWRVVGAADAMFNLAAMAIAAAFGAVAGVGAPGLVALSISGGLRNIALALTVAVALLGRPDIAVAATVHVFIMNASALALVALRRRFALARDQGTAG